MNNAIKAGLAAVVGLWAGLPVMVQVLVALQVLDFATGTAAAYINRSLDSVVSFRGLVRKFVILLLVATGAVIDRGSGLSLPIGADVAGVIAGFMSIQELLSIIENADRAGVPVPSIIRTSLQQAQAGMNTRTQGGRDGEPG